MSVVVLPVTKENAKEISARRRHVQLSFAPVSQLPYRVEKKTTGQRLGGFETPEAVVAFLLGCSVEELARKPASMRSTR